MNESKNLIKCQESTRASASVWASQNVVSSNQPLYDYTRSSLDDVSINKTAVTNPGPGYYSSATDNKRYSNAPSYGVGTARRSDMAN